MYCFSKQSSPVDSIVESGRADLAFVSVSAGTYAHYLSEIFAANTNAPVSFAVK